MKQFSDRGEYRDDDDNDDDDNCKSRRRRLRESRTIRLHAGDQAWRENVNLEIDECRMNRGLQQLSPTIIQLLITK